MRTWLYNRIRAVPGLPAGMADRVISSGSASNPKTPFIILQMGTEQPPFGLPASARAQSIPFTVWVHDLPGSMLNIDNVSVLLKDHIPTEDGQLVGGMSVYEVRWEATGEDAYDDHFGTNTRPIRFSMMTRR